MLTVVMLIVNPECQYANCHILNVMAPKKTRQLRRNVRLSDARKRHSSFDEKIRPLLGSAKGLVGPRS